MNSTSDGVVDDAVDAAVLLLLLLSIDKVKLQQ